MICDPQRIELRRLARQLEFCEIADKLEIDYIGNSTRKIHASDENHSRNPPPGLKGEKISANGQMLFSQGRDSARKGSHLFRHTLATELLRQGASPTSSSSQGRHVDLPRIQPTVNQIHVYLCERQWFERPLVEIVHGRPTGQYPETAASSYSSSLLRHSSA
jgi:hypothetical protein